MSFTLLRAPFPNPLLQFNSTHAISNIYIASNECAGTAYPSYRSVGSCEATTSGTAGSITTCTTSSSSFTPPSKGYTLGYYYATSCPASAPPASSATAYTMYSTSSCSGLTTGAASCSYTASSSSITWSTCSGATSTVVGLMALLVATLAVSSTAM